MINLAGIFIATILALVCLIAITRPCLADEMIVKVKPAGTGKQIVRMSLPFAEAAVLEGQTLRVSDGYRGQVAALRPLTWYPVKGDKPKSVRRGIVTFPYTFLNNAIVRFSLRSEQDNGGAGQSFPVDIDANDEAIEVSYGDNSKLRISLMAPKRTSQEAVIFEVVESNANFLWERYHIPDPEWPRIIEVRADAFGSVTIVAHLQRNQPDNGRAPDFGWKINFNSQSEHIYQDGLNKEIPEEMQSYRFADGLPVRLFLSDGDYRVYHPAAASKRRGGVEIHRKDNEVTYRYWRCRAYEQVPMQEATWRRAEIVIAPSEMAELTASLEYPHIVQVDDKLWDKLYSTGLAVDLTEHPELENLVEYHHNATLHSMSRGDDWGNITSFSDGRDAGAIHGMNRLNHCPAIFEEGYRSGDQRLIETAVLWCNNFYDLTIWWGEDKTGGTRYNNVTGPDKLYMWRSNNSVHFCTKGYDSFFMAYEQTGDPRMMEALEAQTKYAAEHIHSDQGEARNIGDVADFIRLYEFTGEQKYLDEALRLFRELRTKLSTGDLFSQSGRPIVPDPPFIDDDQTGYKHPFAKPYIIGYALAGLPKLLRYAPKEPKLQDVVQAVADFLAESQDPVGGWRYPHPRSSHASMSQAMEHAWQIVQADKAIGAQKKHLDAIENVLRQRIQGWIWTGRIFSSLGSWEIATGKAEGRDKLYEMYQKPSDRDYAQDYVEGQFGFGGSPPEGIVYFPEVLAFYLKHRPADRLLAPATDTDPLGKVLKRVPRRRAEKEEMIVIAENPSPGKLPTLEVWRNEKQVFVSAEFPNIKDSITDSWCYESNTEFIGASALDGGRIELRHRDKAQPHVIVVTMVIPEPKAVDFVARIELDKENYPDAEMPDSPTSLNLCWQLQRAPVFASRPDPYPEFVKRCFIFTENGIKYLDQTVRRKIPCRDADDRYNNPPWVQMYVEASQDIPEVRPQSWADYSTDRYATTVIGAVSRYGRYLSAIANDSATTMCQAWHDCMHNNPRWLPADAPVEERRWRLKVYAMENDPKALLKRVGEDFPNAKHNYQTLGIEKFLPAFRNKLADRLTFPLSWLSGNIQDFDKWRNAARAKVMECLLSQPPSVPFEPVVIAEQDRETYVARKVVFNISGDSRVLGLMLVPKGEGPFPAVLTLHDHGARFDIGKEKVIRPWDVPDEKLESAEQWVNECYGGRWIGDELAKRGYMCFSTDALNWSDRGGAGYEGQQALAGNLLHLGMSFAGLIAYEDMRAAEFLATRPEVDESRVGAMGLSMGSFRTWQVSALSDHIAAGAAICWMATAKGLMVPDNNQTRGQSCYTMLHPDLFNYLDYPDVASMACPKPMLFYNGEQDGLFPVPSAKEAYAKMRKIWESQSAGGRLVTKIWDVPHEFNKEMQAEAFEWLDKQLSGNSE